ncbi:branched-chain amino acid aminotransferase 4-amino-4-deoxychorismate lyase, putative [Babesia ovata]|uniref:Branched-chain amino acid aminotransferase 4-amino-4-deoxychorismate lyase, putative n=1 Tax=Babesia ovata TaxID=189622 RepID=A0A2H6KBV6_9APIC|nr:branched-chain amino acid aminotransferase 4-amino-4-deoxychorismate lyase, putative [Babesia ovata]GBE60472.1 branched-chain amino acid aminotransferase 4-amino-4-deoxychorismate lyase, putative [Babesia ovata]
MTDENDWGVGGGYSRQGATATGVPVELGDDHTTDVHRLVESGGLVVTGLTDMAVHDENDVVGFHRLVNEAHFLEQRLLLLVTTGGIDDDDVVLLLLELGHTFSSNPDGIGLAVATEKGNFHLGRILLQLVKGTGTECVRANQRSAPPLALVVVRKLGAGCRFTRTLQADEHDNIRLTLLRRVRLAVAGEHGNELLNHRLEKMSIVANWEITRRR